MKFVIIGPALSGNKGAAAMLESAVQTITAANPKASFTLLSHYPSADAKLNTYKNLRIVSATPAQLAFVINPLSLAYRLLPFMRKTIRRKQPAIDAIVEADAVLDQGGITFNDGREIYLLFNVATILPALFLRTKVVKCAQALGPFKNPINRITSKIFLPRLATIVSRGSYTRKNLDELGLRNVIDGADYAFSLRVGVKEQKAGEKFLDQPLFARKGLLVGLSPSSVIQKRLTKSGVDYVQMMKDFSNELIARGYNVALLPHSMRKGTNKRSFVSLFVGKSHNDDVALCREIYSGVSDKSHSMLLDKEIGAQELRVIIGRCDVFVASRFHAMVAALATRVPVLVMGWSHKYAEVLQMFDSENLALDYKGLDTNKLIERLEEIIADRKAIKQRISKHLPAVSTLSEQHVAIIMETINEKS